MQVIFTIVLLSLVIAQTQSSENHPPLKTTRRRMIVEDSNKPKHFSPPSYPNSRFSGEQTTFSRDWTKTKRQGSVSPDSSDLMRRLHSQENNTEVHARHGLYSNDAMPPIPRSFITRVEITKTESAKNSVIQGIEMFDGVLNKGVLTYKIEQSSIGNPHTVEKIVQYSLSDDVALLIHEQKKGPDCQKTGSICVIEKLCSASNVAGANLYLFDFFGYINSDHESGVLGVTGILQWGPEGGYEYSGEAECRGMLCDKWDAYNEVLSTHITFYWSAKKWTVNGEEVQVPVAIELGSYEGRVMQHRYDFYEFHGGLRPGAHAITPASDLFCQERKESLLPPHALHTIRYSAEITIGPQRVESREARDLINTRGAEYETNYYDWDKQISMLQYTPWLNQNEEKYDYEINEIHDFNQGLAYLVWPHLSNACNITDLKNDSVDRSSPFVYMEEPMQYNGVHIVRGIPSAAWAGRKKLPGSDSLNETFVFYFETHSAEGVSSTQKSHFIEQRPIRFEKYSEQTPQQTYLQYNIYDYDAGHPMTHTLDVSSCYMPSDMRHFILDLPANTLPRIHFELQKLLYYSQGEIALVANVSDLRINRISMENRTEGPRLLFTVLGKPLLDRVPYAAQQEASLDEAVERLQAAVDLGTIFILVSVGIDEDHPGEPLIVAVRPLPYTMREVSRVDSHEYSYEVSRGYESDDMAGLALGLLAVGVLASAVGAVAYTKYFTPAVVTLPRVHLAHSQNTPVPSHTITLDHDLTASNI